MVFKIYWETLLLGLKQITNYRFEMWLGTFTRFIGLGGLLILWSVIYKDNPDLNLNEILGYLLVANSVRDAIDAQHLKLAKEFINEIKMGTISSHLLRPINPKLFLYFRFFGNRSVNLVFDLFLLIIGLSINPPKSLIGLALFLLSVIIAIGISYCINVLVGTITFWISDASGFRNVANHLIKVFSGSLIPISFFPEVTKNIILLSPFPVLSYLPAVFISSNEVSMENIKALVVSIVWLLVLIPLVNKMWLKGVRDYEAIGI